ncbi:MAG: Mur ligase family protein, partial [Endozoicomonadaceae bacterium]|nr:Mur ligase family protein [Endozoicomonadaceae bacterium]
LNQWLTDLENRRPEHDMLLGTDRMKKVLPAVIGTKKIAKKIITITGTNGKGSTVALLEQMLKETGVRYGTTTSPHMFKINERICINGHCASDATICAAFEKIEQKRGDVFLSYFEFIAMTAFDIFAQYDLDVAVLEIGLGGRLDAINAIDPDIAIITTVDLDHQSSLGDTIEQIAAEKAGIYRPGIPALYGDTPIPQSVSKKVQETGAQAFFRNQEFMIKENKDSWIFQGKDYSDNAITLENLPKPSLAFTSAICMVQTALLLGPFVNYQHIIAGLQKTKLFGRNFCKTVTTPTNATVNIRFDIAHNPQAARNFAGILSELPVKGQRIALFAMAQEKDFKQTLEPLIAHFDQWHVATIAYKPRALKGQYIYDWLKNQVSSVICHDTLPEAASVIISQLKTGDELVVFGSHYTVSETFNILCDEAAVAPA